MFSICCLDGLAGDNMQMQDAIVLNMLDAFYSADL